MSAVARVDGLSHAFGRRTALEDVSLELGRGVTGLVGVNGAGKSTLLRILGLGLRPTSGSVSLVGREDRGLAEARRTVALMPQSANLPGRLRVADFLAYVAWLRAVPRRDRARAVERALALSGLEDRARSRYADLSGGMQRRVLLGQALLADPALLLLDEPTASLDPEQRVRIRDVVAEQGRRRAVVVSSHLIEDLVPVADRIVMLDAGRVAFDGSPADWEQLGAEHVAAGSPLTPHEAAFLVLRKRAESPS